MVCSSLFCCWRRRSMPPLWWNNTEKDVLASSKSSKGWTSSVGIGATWLRNAASTLAWETVSASVYGALEAPYKRFSFVRKNSLCLFIFLATWLGRSCLIRVVMSLWRTSRNTWWSWERRWLVETYHWTSMRSTRWGNHCLCVYFSFD